jgi:hypothetical protein
MENEHTPTQANDGKASRAERIAQKGARIAEKGERIAKKNAEIYGFSTPSPEKPDEEEINGTVEDDGTATEGAGDTSEDHDDTPIEDNSTEG